MKYCVVIKQKEDDVFVVEVPSLPGCVAQGKTRQEAIENSKQAIDAYLESLAFPDDMFAPSVSEDTFELTF
jgi:predicted RNase H-like HicB family nuclease